MRAKLKTGRWYIAIIAGILVLAVVILRQYILDGYYFMSKGVLSDLLRANLPTYYHMYDAITEGGFFWSWQMGIGTSMFTHADVYFDPFTYILFIFGRDYIPHMMIWLFVAKLVCEGAAFFSYLDYFKLDRKASLIAALLYAFSGYSLIMGSNFALGTILVYAPIVFLGVEKWLDTGKLRTLLLGLFLTCIYSYYFFFVLGLLTALYVCVRLYQRRINPIPKLFVLLGVAVVVILLSSVALLPQIQLTLASARVAGAKDVQTGLSLWIPQIKVWVTAIIRALCGDILNNPLTGEYIGYTYFGIMDYFQVSCYTSSFLIILAMQYWHYEKKNRKNLILVTVLISIMILFPVFSFVLNAFATVSARWMFIVTILECVLIGLSIDSVIRNKGIHGKSLFWGIIASGLIMILGMMALSAGGNEFGAQFTVYLYQARKFFVALLGLYALMCVIYILQRENSRAGMRKWAICILVAGIILIDEGINYYHWYGIEQSVSDYSEAEKTSYEDTSAELIKEIQAEDDSFYRINKTFDSVVDVNEIPSENDAMVQQYYGLKSYNSVNNANYTAFLQELGVFVACPISIPYYLENGIEPEEVIGSNLNYIDGVGDRYYLQSYLGVKYFITDQTDSELPEYFTYLNSRNGISVYENKNYYPLAFVNEKLMSLEEFRKLSDEEKAYALLEYTIVDGIDTTGSSLAKSEKRLTELAKEKQEKFELISFFEDKVSFRIEVQEGAEYLSLSMPYDEDWHAYVDGKEVATEKVNVSLLGVRIGEGEHEVELRYEPKALKIGGMLSLAGLILVLILWKTAGFLIEKLERILKKSGEGILRVIHNAKVQKAMGSLLKGFGYIVVALSISAVTIGVIRPSTYIKGEVENITEFSEMDTQGYTIDGQSFLVSKNKPSMTWQNTLSVVSKVEIRFSSIDYMANSDGGLRVQLSYDSDGSGFNEENSMVQWPDNENLTVRYDMEEENVKEFRLAIGWSEGEAFHLESIRIENKYFQMTLKECLLVGGTAILVLAGLLWGVRRVRGRQNNSIVRDSNIELCRIICMLLIVAHHCVLHGGAFEMQGMSQNRIFSLFLIPGGKLCFDSFLAMSCWFLVDQKFRTKRFLKVWLQVLFYSVTFAIIAYGFGTGFTFKNWLSTLLPITGNSHGFAASYLAFYLLLPFLTYISGKVTKRQARWLLVLLLYFEVGSQIIGCFNSYYQPLSSELLLFILCYVIALNLKRWPWKICDNKKLMLTIFIGIWIGLWMIRYCWILNPGNPVLSYIMSTMCDESSITNLVGGFAFFFFFKNIKMKKYPLINYLATGTFGILLIHDHNFFRYVLWKQIIRTEEWYESGIFVLIVIAVVIWVYAVGFLIDRVRVLLLEQKIFRHVKVNEMCEKCDAILAEKNNKSEVQ